MTTTRKVTVRMNAWGNLRAKVSGRIVWESGDALSMAYDMRERFAINDADFEAIRGLSSAGMSHTFKAGERTP